MLRFTQGAIRAKRIDKVTDSTSTQSSVEVYKYNQIAVEHCNQTTDQSERCISLDNRVASDQH